MNRIETISIRIPVVLLSRVQAYAEERGFVRADGVNISGTILAILREKFNCKAPNDTVTEIELNSRLSDLESRLRAELAAIQELFSQQENPPISKAKPEKESNMQLSQKVKAFRSRSVAQILRELGLKSTDFYNAKANPTYPSSKRIFEELTAVGGENIAALKARYPDLEPYL